jgi:hypothetical protein
MRQLCQLDTKAHAYICGPRYDNTGNHAAVWIIRDGSHRKSTRCPAHDIAGAERALALYIATKHTKAARQGGRDPDQIPIADVLIGKRVVALRADVYPQPPVPRVEHMAVWEITIRAVT